MLMRAITLFFLLAASVAQAQVVSPFAGSEALGEYRADFVRFHYLVQDGGEVETATAEGQILSRIFKPPEGRSNFEVFRSFESALRAEGFEMIAVLDDNRQVELLAREANSSAGNNFGNRPYTVVGSNASVGAAIKALVATQAQEYIAARKTVDQSDLLVVVSTSRSGNYVIEELTSAGMEQGTVVLTLDALRGNLSNEGRIALYGIHFATGSANILPDSAQTLDIIVQYLRENPQQYFYVVGHTDDEGSLANNMTLSAARAEAVVAAIVAELPESRDRLTPRGVGPLSPVATNGAADGRTLNRRVELVSSIE